MLTLAAVLAMPAIRSADPEVLTGADRLDREVRWVHTTELADIGPLLRGGDLVLTTGIALPEHDDALSGFAAGLAESDAAGLVIELGRRWGAVPPALVAACATAGLPLVALRREARFAAVAQAVGERLVDEQVAELRAAQRVHETFTRLSIEEAGDAEILRATRQLAGAPVAVESGRHQILDFHAGPGEDPDFLTDWERRSRQVRGTARTAYDPSNGWLVTPIGRAERGWGRLVIGSPAPPSQRLIAVAERAAAALALHRLHDRSRDSRIRRTHHELLVALLADAGDAETQRRVEALGVPLTGRQYVGLALRPRAEAGAGSPDDLVAACLAATEATRTPALVSAFDAEVRVLLALPGRGDAVRGTDRWAEALAERVPADVAAGTPVSALGAADRTLAEATQVLAVAAAAPGVRRLQDAHVRGLLALLADDDRLTAFVARELGPLIDHPDLLRATRVLIEHWGNKAAAAAALNLSRTVLYDRIDRLGTLLGRDLADPETRTSLHLALLAADLPGRG